MQAPEQDDGGLVAVAVGEEDAEIGVGRDDHAVVAPSGLQYGGIGGSRESEITCVRCVESRCSESYNRKLWILDLAKGATYPPS